MDFEFMLHRFDDIDQLTAAALELLLEEASRAISRHGCFSLAISGGTTPVKLFESLGEQPAGSFPKEHTDVFWCDERMVPYDHPWSNFGSARRLWFSPAGYPARNLHPVATNRPLAEAERNYEDLLRSHLTPPVATEPSFVSPKPAMQENVTGDIREKARLDLCILGMGEDGHVASLFPGCKALKLENRWVAGVRPPPSASPKVERVTLTLEALTSAHQVLVMTAGYKKAELVHKVLAGAGETADMPVALLAARRSITWLVSEQS